MEANTARHVLRVRLMVSMIAPLVLIAGVAFAGHEQSAKRKIVLFREGTTPQVQRQVIERHGYRVLHHLRRLNAVSIALPDDNAENSLAALRRNRQVSEVYPDPEVVADHVVSIAPVRLPPGESFPWGVERIGVPLVFKLIASQRSSGPTVAILDTGIDIYHPELAGQIVDGYNARIGEDPADYQDYNGHGTHMAGIIAAACNGFGIIGTAIDPQLVAVKVLDDSGHGLLSDLINGLEWVLEQDIRVVNMSLSFSEGSPLLEELTKKLYDAGVIMIASAGNRCTGPLEEGGDEEGGDSEGGAAEEGGDSGCEFNSTQVKYPAAYRRVVAVVATDTNNKLTAYNRTGPEVDLSAPGGAKESGEILSITLNGGYGLGKGTSQAAAHVTGGVAVALQLAPWLTVKQVIDLLKGTAKNLGYSESQQGAGLLAVDVMVRSLLGMP
jgi:subtilisin